METPDPDARSVPTSNQEQSSPVAESPKKSPLTPLLLSLLGIPVVAGMVYGGYWYGRIQTKRSAPTTQGTSKPTIVPTTNPTANWKTYTSTKYGYSFKYPEDWLANNVTSKIDPSSPITDIVYLSNTGGISLENKKISFTVQAVDNSDFPETIKSGEPLMGNLGFDTEFSVVIIDGKEIVTGVRKQLWDPSTNQPLEKIISYEAVISLDKNTLFVESDPEEKQTVDQILSTFKFLGKDEKENAKTALISYFNLLSEGKYQEATQYHGSEYYYIQSFCPSVEQDDEGGLLECGCSNAFECLKVKEVLNEKTISPAEFIFTVTFLNEDGTTFKRGQCCGGTEEGMPTQTDFEYKVKRVNNNYKVLTQLIYTP